MERKPLFSVTKEDCKWDYYVGSGKGGQKRNKTSNCVRCTHIDSGAVGKSEEGRSQAHNKKNAFRKMAESPRFKAWVKLESARISGKEAELQQEVERAMHSSNIRVETKDSEGRWVVSDE